MLEQMSGQGALERLLDPAARVQTEVAIPEGLRLTDTVQRLAEASGLPESDFDARCKTHAGWGSPTTPRAAQRDSCSPRRTPSILIRRPSKC